MTNNIPKTREKELCTALFWLNYHIDLISDDINVLNWETSSKDRLRDKVEERKFGYKLKYLTIKKLLNDKILVVTEINREILTPYDEIFIMATYQNEEGLTFQQPQQPMDSLLYDKLANKEPISIFDYTDKEPFSVNKSIRILRKYLKMSENKIRFSSIPVVTSKNKIMMDGGED